MLSLQFQALSNADMYRIYLELYNKNEEKDDIIKRYVLTTSNFITRTSTNYQLCTFRRTNGARKVKAFNCFPIKNEENDLVIDSNLVKIRCLRANNTTYYQNS